MLRAVLVVILVVAGGCLIYAGVHQEWPGFAGLAQPNALLQAQNPVVLDPAPQPDLGPQRFWQTGASAGPEARDATAMRTTIRTRIPRTIADQTTDYFWIGAYLADGSFIQAGYAVPWYDHTPHWFYCAFTPAGAKGPCAFGAAGSAGPNGAWSQYALQSAPGPQLNTWRWSVLVDNHPVATFTEAAGTTGHYTPGVYVEQSAFTPHAPTNDLGPVEFYPAIEYQSAAQPVYAAAPHAQASYSDAGACPPYGIGVAGVNDVLLGNTLACLPEGTGLW